jgi:hypothetical protein
MRMKTLITFFVALLLGLALGSVLTLRHADHEVAEVVETMQQPIESGDREHAARAIRAIQMIESGESSNAVQLLSVPIAVYYHFYAGLTQNDERTKAVLAQIEQLASTNTLIADEIHAKIQ